MTDNAPGSAEWNRVVSASKVAAILGVSKWDSQRSIWHKMRNEVPPQPQTSVMSRGHFLEPAILRWWRSQHPEMEWVERHQTFKLGDWAAATPDAVGWPDAPDVPPVLVEAKSANSLDEWGAPGTDAIPTEYLTQCYWSLHLAHKAYPQTPPIITCYVPIIGPFLEFAEYVVTYDPAIGADLEARCRAFYDSLTADEPPPLDDSLATYEVLRAMHPDIDRAGVVELSPQDAYDYVTACNDLAVADQRARGIKSLLLDAMGTARLAKCDGQTIARRQPTKGAVSLRQVAKSFTLPDETSAA
jgi:predicted phage-related endonuclease